MSLYTPLVVARFWSKVIVTKGVDRCWEWTGCANPQGYGKIKIGGIRHTASRVAWELYHGEDLGDRLALHECDNPSCCNPTHIFAGSHQDNMQDNMDDKAQKGRAPGHSLPRARNPMAKLTEESVVAMRARFARGETNTVIAADFGIGRGTVSAIRCGKIWAPLSDGE